SQKSVQEIVELNSPGLHENKKTLLQSALQEKFIVDLDLANPLPSQQENGLTDEKIREAFEKAVDQALLGNVGSLAKLIVDHALEPDKINDNKNESIDKVLRTKMAADPNAKTLAMKVFQEQGNAAQKREANQFFLKTGNPDEKLAAAKEVIKDKDNPAELEIMKLAHLQMLDSNDLSEKLTSARELREPTYKDIITSDEIIPVNLLLLKHSESPPEQQTAAKELSEHPDDANKIIAYRYLVKSNEDHTSLKAAKALRDLSSDENDNKIANSYLLNKSPNGSSDKIVAAFNLRNAEGAEGMNAKEYLNTKHFMETKLDFTIISSEDEEKDIETPQRIVSIYSANLNPEEAKALINPNMDGALQQSRIHVWSESLVATSDNTYSLEEQRQVGLAKVLAFKDQGLQRQASEREQKAEIKKIGPMIFSGTWTPTEAAIAVNFGIGTGEPIKIKLGFTIETDDHSKITYKLVNQDPQWVFETAEGNAIDRKRFLGNVKGHLFRKSPIEKLLINLETLTNNEPFSNKFSDNDKKEAGNAFYKIYTELEKSDPDMTKDLTKNFEIRYTDKKLQCLPRNKEEYPPEKVDLPHPS
ncbi:MAG TPA: hypothetical protein VLH77_06070, partial [Gammaproteobacteria bacterium]|nr:hypothetical protein [Gammaproteobacteria bacterium]